MEDDWITRAEAMKIISDNSGHDVDDSYIRHLAKDGKVETKALDGRTKLYKRSQVETIIVRQRKKGQQTHE